MKTTLYAAAVAMWALCFAACDTDRDDNPTYSSDNLSITLQNPDFTGAVLSLYPEDVDMTFTWSSEGQTFPYVTTYTLQISNDPSFPAGCTLSQTAATGGTATTSGQTAVSSNTLNGLLQNWYGWTENDLLTSVDLYARVYSQPSAVSPERLDTVYSNTISFAVAPTWVLLAEAEPVLWYILGDQIGSGAWSTGASKTYVENIPFFASESAEYDKTTGTGEISYTDYFLADKGFKILSDSWDWNYAMCGNGAGKFIYRDGAEDDPGNITVSEDGYYTITINTLTNEGTIEAYSGTPVVYSDMTLKGSFDSWGTGVALKAINTVEGMRNHNWYAKNVKLNAGEQMKFTSGSDWWGYGSADGTVPEKGYGLADTSKSNIGVAEAGSYTIFFNDITGYFRFIKE